MDIEKTLTTKGFKYKKEFGQNFIFDRNLLQSICDDAALSKDDEVLEIGAGGGTLTQLMCERAGKVVAFEIDKNLTEHLNAMQNEMGNLTIFIADYLEVCNEDILKHFAAKIKVVANLPYYITTPIIFKLLENIERIDSIFIMVQKEVAMRIIATTQKAEMNILACMIQSMCDVRVTRIVPREFFSPSPNVDSAIVALTPHGNKYGIENIQLFSSIVKAGFHMKRKTLVNNLAGFLGKSKEDIQNALAKLSIPSNIRAEKLEITDWVSLMNILGK